MKNARPRPPTRAVYAATVRGQGFWDSEVVRAGTDPATLINLLRFSLILFCWEAGAGVELPGGTLCAPGAVGDDAQGWMMTGDWITINEDG